MGLALKHPDWVLGFQDEVWWSRIAQPHMHSWAEENKALRLIEKEVPKGEIDPKALACYGLWLAEDDMREMLLRFVDGRPVSAVTTRYLEWCCRKLWERGKRVLVMVWDNAPWHVSKEVREWIKEHNYKVKYEGGGNGVRILACYLPTKSPWLNPIEPKWLHGKRRVVQADRLLSSHELAQRVCDAFDCPYEGHLSIPDMVP
jgi:DDE superfamily endonuclease